MDGRARHTANSGASYRAFQLQRNFDAPAASPAPLPTPASTAAPLPTDQVALGPEQRAAQEAYTRWSDPATLDRELSQRGTNLNGFTEQELQALAALSIDHPELRTTIQSSVIGTVRDAESLEDVPSSVGFQHLLETMVLDPPEELRESPYWSTAHANYDNMVEEEIGRLLDDNLEGARGDDGLDAALEDFGSDLEDFVRGQPASASLIEENTREQFEMRNERFGDIKRADDPWYADANHAVTGAVRSFASEVADTFFPAAPGVNKNRPYVGPAADFFNNPAVREATLFSAGFSMAGRSSVESIAALVTDPVNSAKALAEVVKDPSLLLAGYREAYENYGVSGTAGAVGFDLMTAAIGAAVVPQGIGASAVRALIRGGREALDQIPFGRAGRAAVDATTDLLESRRFTDLPTDLQDRIITAANIDVADVNGRNAIIGAVESDGFTALDLAEQERLIRYVGGENPYISQPARRQLDALMQDESFRAMNATEQAERLRQFTSAESPFEVLAPPPGSTRPLVDATLGPAQATSHPFLAGQAAGQSYSVQIDGRTVEVIVPDNVVPGSGAHPSVQQVVDGLRSIPEANRAAVDRIILETAPDARNGTFASGANSYMTAGADGSVRLFPQEGTPPIEFFSSTLVHETGHILTHRAWGAPTSYVDGAGQTRFRYEGAEWDRYAAAAQEDGVLPSGYSRTDIGEDAAETARIYAMVRGTPFEAEVRAIYANRFELLDELLEN
jgi:hypothetical protein